MKTILLTVSLLLLSSISPIHTAWAEDVSEEQQTQEQPFNQWQERIQNRYSLNEQQMKALSESGLNHAGATKAAHLAQESGKSIEEVLKLRAEKKMGWGKIAKQLGVHPGELGKANAWMKQERNQERKQKQTEKHANKMSKKQERKQSRMQQRMDKRMEKKAMKKGKGKHN